MSTLPADGAWFGAGGEEPWARTLQTGTGDLVLEQEDGDWSESLDVSRWRAAADDADRTVLESLTGPVLDVGCGPGRMVRAALDTGLAALGIDVSSTVVAHCRERGLPVLERSVFDALPQEGRWGAVLLLDGNIGIGGRPDALLQRSADLLAPGGAVVVEAHPDPLRDARFTGRVVRDGSASAPFRWSQAGEQALLRAAGDLRLDHAWTADGRRFLRFRAA